jgi:hypothetical protein
MRPSAARDEFLLAATGQNFRKLAKLIPIPTLNSGTKPRLSPTRSPCSHLSVVYDFAIRDGRTVGFDVITDPERLR